MEYYIHHLNLIGPQDQRSFFEEEIRHNLSRFDEIFQYHSGRPVLHIFIKKEANDHYSIFASIHINDDVILVKEEGKASTLVVHNALEKLQRQVRRQLQQDPK